MSAQLAPPPIFQAITPQGAPAVGYQLGTFIAGTSTPQATYLDSTQTTSNTNPIILNSMGQANIWLNPILAYKFVMKDAAGNPVWTVDNINSPALTQAVIGQLLYPTLAGETGVVTNVYPVGNVLRYGADPTGAASSYAAFTSAIAICAQTGTPVIVPAGQYNLPTSNPAIFCAFVTFQGAGVSKGSSIDAAGSVLNFTGTTTTNSAFSIGPGVSFYNLGFYYPSQIDSPTPIAFAPTIVTNLINGAINFVYIQNCVVWNAYRFFVDTDATGSIGHVWLLDNTIYGILTCFELAYNAEIITIQGNEFTFGHYLTASEGGLRGYTRANGSVLKVIRTDGITFSGNVLFGYLNGINFVTAATICQLTSICDNYFDQCLFPIIATGTGNLSNVTISANVLNAFNSQSAIPATVGNCIKITTSGALALESIVIDANMFGTANGDTVLISGVAPRSLTITGNIINGTGAYQTSGAFGCLNISGTSTSYNVNGNNFVNQASVAGVANGILGTPVDAVISGNIFGGFQSAINGTFNVVLASANVSYSTLGTFANNYNTSGTITDAGNSWDKNSAKSPNVNPIATYGNYANDAAAAAAGVPVGGQYRNGSVVQVRVV